MFYPRRKRVSKSLIEKRKSYQIVDPGVPVQQVDNVSFEERHNFYWTKEWVQLSNMFKHRNDRGHCEVCGRKWFSDVDTERNVDHIKPIKYFWELRLDYDNLQMCCSECNREKGNSLNYKNHNTDL